MRIQIMTILIECAICVPIKPLTPKLMSPLIAMLRIAMYTYLLGGRPLASKFKPKQSS